MFQLDDAIIGYEAASELDETLNGADIIADIHRHAKRLEEMVERKGKLKAKKLKALLDTIPTTATALGDHKHAFVADLKPGDNEGAVILKIIIPAVSTMHVWLQKFVNELMA